MTPDFRSFVIFAEMRTGSNLLEATLNAIKRVTCFGEAFNPYMMGWPNTDALLGVTQEEREADPLPLLEKLTGKENHLPGFRYFHDHDPRVLEAIMANRSCAKIILTRNPLESYVSTRLAWETNQWKLNESEVPIQTQITYDSAEFRENLFATQEFQQRVVHQLQVSGQSYFAITYQDLRDADVLTGLLHWLGRTDLERVEPATDQVPQNPQDMAQKVRNFDEMQADLHQLDPFLLHHLPNFEPRRGPAVPGFSASGAGRGLIHMPLRGGPVAAVQDWLQQLGAVQGDFTQSSLRQWKRAHPGHRSFTVLRHPLHRAWDAFRHLLTGAPEEQRRLLRQVHRLDLPPVAQAAGLTPDQTADLFRDFLQFLRRNLNGQTTLPTHPNWATQSAVVAGFARFSSPDLLVREDQLAEDLDFLCRAAGVESPQLQAPGQAQWPDLLSDKKLQQAAQAAYQRDYIAFGFDRAP
ncbi:sulfotransferase family 2 domain-containing protein [Paracoccus fistulariae]|uniref:Sulfotransferase family 2 domain-containing protein n=1 Tax=Paracoccus fistulariae TaxID=658446 RepID=A0ABY7SK57_9RHOB|nr:sulfotransferase family 2 domain-containing protein [Paracoccus fistulariae]MDB6181123.1 sulfotransferase family 2 domain-containing protein [Paracoccus fistulariae]WCR06412.1 sulfotransferase family 2 domain-containing protein [Paracoccus fistulariae]